MGDIWKALEKGYLEHLGLHDVLTICLSSSSVLDGACVTCCLVLSTGSYHQQLAKHISRTYCSDDAKRGMEIVHFDVLNSKMQEFAL